MSDKQFDVYAENENFRIEYLKHLTMILVDKANGQCKVIPYQTKISDVKDAVTRFGDDKTIKTYLKLSEKQDWQPMYKV